MNIQEKINQYRELGDELANFKRDNFPIGTEVLHVSKSRGFVSQSPRTLSVAILHHPVQLSEDGIWVKFDKGDLVYVGLENVTKI